MSTRDRLHHAALVLTLLVGAPAHAYSLLSSENASLEAGGDVKSFLVGVVPYKHRILPQDPSARGLMDLRLKIDGSLGDWLRVTLHPNVFGSFGTGPGALGAGAVARLGTLPEAVGMTRTFRTPQGLQVTGRIDRAAVTLRLPHLDVTVGRQAMSFGSTFFFTPLDVVAPFSPLVVDREYKPGIDALRLDAFTGTSNKLTLVAAYAGGWNLGGLILASHLRTTFRDVDLGVFIAEVQRNFVLGTDAAGELLGFGLRGEATVTVPPDGRSPYVRATIGMDRRLESGLYLSGEVYYQSVGAARPDRYFGVTELPEFRRGELWALGRYYAAVAASYELLPIMTVGTSCITNLGDRSALVGANTTYSLSDNAVLVAGGYLTLGDRPSETPTGDPARPIKLRSEFGSAPSSAYLQFRAYF